MTNHQNKTAWAGIFIKIGIAIGCVAAVAFLAVGFICFSEGNSAFFKGDLEQLGKLASLGSYLQGTTAAFWALSGVCLIFVAFLAQMIQINSQREELELTRADLEEQQQRLDRQETIAVRQSFESSFFQLLNLHNQIVNALTETDTSPLTPQVFIGRACFERWYRQPDPIIFREDEQPILPSSAERYMEIYDGHQGELGHYFRNLYHVIKFVKESDALKNADPAIEYNNRRRYTSLVRATLSQFELALLFYNGLSDNGEKFKPLIEEFGLLENFNRNDLYNRKEDEKLYDPKAFA